MKFKGLLLLFHTTIEINQRLKGSLVKQKYSCLVNRKDKEIANLCHFVSTKKKKSATLFEHSQIPLSSLIKEPWKKLFMIIALFWQLFSQEYTIFWLVNNEYYNLYKLVSMSVLTWVRYWYIFYLLWNELYLAEIWEGKVYLQNIVYQFKLNNTRILEVLSYLADIGMCWSDAPSRKD